MGKSGARKKKGGSNQVSGDSNTNTKSPSTTPSANGGGVDLDSSIFLKRAHELKEEGNKRFQSKDYGAALEQYENALRLTPKTHADRAVFHSNRAACMMQMKPVDYDAVISECTAALQIQPLFVRALLRRARAFEALGNPDSAMLDVQLLLSADPNHRDALDIARRLRASSAPALGPRPDAQPDLQSRPSPAASAPPPSAGPPSPASAPASPPAPSRRNRLRPLLLPSSRRRCCFRQAAAAAAPGETPPPPAETRVEAVVWLGGEERRWRFKGARGSVLLPAGGGGAVEGVEAGVRPRHQARQNAGGRLQLQGAEGDCGQPLSLVEVGSDQVQGQRRRPRDDNLHRRAPVRRVLRRRDRPFEVAPRGGESRARASSGPATDKQMRNPNHSM